VCHKLIILLSIFSASIDTMKSGYVINIEQLSLENDNFRKVLYTGEGGQLVLMSLRSGEEIGEEVHDVDQFLRIEKGRGTAILADTTYEIQDGSSVFVPAGTKHNIINGESEAMKLYTLYMPPHHKDGVIHETKADAEHDTEDEFDGKTTE
jgi:mannose-6-phosphate isomerase-like protein (cupin superfamily)